jgi:hypothetical protein
VFEPIVVQSGGYEARTDGSALEIRRSNGVVVGEGRIGIAKGAFVVGEYAGEMDVNVYKAVQALLQEHETDLVARWIAAGPRGAPS